MKIKKLLLMVLALLVVLVMATSCGSNDKDEKNTASSPVSVTGPAELSGPVTATLTLEINRDIIPLASSLLEGRIENASDVLNAAVNIAESASLQAVWDGPAIQLNGLLKGQQIAYAAVRADGDKVTAVSDVLPDNSAVQATMNELGYYGDKPLDLNFSPADLGLLEDTVKDMYRTIDKEIAAKTASPEIGSWTFEGATFTSRSKITTTPREIVIIAVKAFRDALQNPKITALLAKVSVDPQSLYLDNTINGLENASEDYFPSLDAYRYTNGNGDVLIDGQLTIYNTHYSYNYETGEESFAREPGAVLNVRYGTIGQNFYLSVTQPGSENAVILTADRRGYNYDFSANLTNITRVQGMSISGKIHASGKTEQNGERSGSINIQAMSMNILTLKYAIKRGGSITAYFDTTGKKLYSFYEATSYSFLRNLRLADIAGKVTSIMPDEATKLAPLVRKLLNR